MNSSPYTLRAAFHRQRVLVCALAVLAVVILPVAIFASVKVAGCLLAGLLAVLAVLRLVLRVEDLGALVVRRRGIDVATLAFFSALIALLSLTPGL